MVRLPAEAFPAVCFLYKLHGARFPVYPLLSSILSVCHGEFYSGHPGACWLPSWSRCCGIRLAGIAQQSIGRQSHHVEQTGWVSSGVLICGQTSPKSIVPGDIWLPYCFGVYSVKTSYRWWIKTSSPSPLCALSFPWCSLLTICMPGKHTLYWATACLPMRRWIPHWSAFKPLNTFLSQALEATSFWCRTS